MIRDLPRIHVCPTCMTPCEVESGYDGPSYEWFCDHAHWHDWQPERVTVSQWEDPSRRETLRQMFAAMRWEELSHGCAQQRAIPLPGYLDLYGDLTWSPADRRRRKAWRDLGHVGRMNAILKAQYLPRIQEHLNQHHFFLAAMEEESLGAHMQAHEDFNRSCYTIPVQRKN